MVYFPTVETLQSLQQDERSLHIKGDRTDLTLSILAPNLLRVRFSPTGAFLPRRSWAVTRDDSEWESIDFDVEQTEEAIQIKTQKMKVSFLRKNSQIHCFDLAGNPFGCDTQPVSLATSYNSVACWKRIEPDEHFYGFGERTSLLDQRGKRRTNLTFDSHRYQALTDEMYAAIPFFIALRPGVGYGLFLNTTFESKFDVGADEPNILRLESRSQELDYYIIYGPEPSQILETYTQLTGRMPIPPKWALGYHQSRWSYETEEQVRKLAQEFRTRQIPCDVIHLDIDYMRGYRVFTWSPTRFPNPKQLLTDLQNQGFKAVTIVDPGVKYEPNLDKHGRYKYDIETPYPVFHEGLEKHYFVYDENGNLFIGYVWPDKSAFPDFTRSDVREWWGNLHHNLIDMGISGIWNDMNEPALDSRPFGDGGEKIFFPDSCPQGDPEERTTYKETHNIYGLMMVKACYEGLQKLRPNQRFFILSRSGFAGLQKWSSLWTGDNQSMWEHLEMSLPMLCNLGLSGIAFVGSDIGGFFSDCNGELLARWTQIGMLYPFMRNHTMNGTAYQEPWRFGEKIETICKEYIELRYRFLPYLYSLFWEAFQTGSPILRPLLYEFPNDEKTYQLYDQVMLGKFLMAAPIYRPGVEHRVVYLPEGIWYDWWTGDRYTGNTHILAHAPLEKMPLYVREGAIIPLAPVMQFVDEQPLTQLRVKVWQGNGEFTLYEDDGTTLEYNSKNSWSTTQYQVHFEEDKILVKIAERQGNWQPLRREVTVEVVGVGEQHFTDDGNAQTLTFPLSHS